VEDFLSYMFDFSDNSLALFSVVFFGAFFNTFFPPVPIEVGVVFGGYLVSQGHGSLLVIIAAATLGMFAGSAVLYQVAKTYGNSILKKPFFARMINESFLKRMEIWLEKYGPLAFVATKFIPGAYFCAVVASGIISLKKTRLYIVILLVNLGAFTMHAMIGKIAGENWRHVYRALGKTGVFLLILIAAAAAVTYFAGKLFRKKIIEDNPPDQNSKFG